MALGRVLFFGLLAGALAGLGVGLFYLATGEPLIEQALTFEAQSHTVEVFSRDVQRTGLVAATVLYGASVGGLFATVFAFVGPRLRTGSVWDRSVRLAAASFLSVWLVPFLKYPSNPPAVGEPGTVGYRTGLYLAMAGVSVLASVAAYLGARRLEDRGLPPHVRQPLIAAAYLGAVGLLYTLFPANPDPVALPASLLWSVRLSSLGGQSLLWSLLALVFGLLAAREARRASTEVAVDPRGS